MSLFFLKCPPMLLMWTHTWEAGTAISSRSSADAICDISLAPAPSLNTPTASSSSRMTTSPLWLMGNSPFIGSSVRPVTTHLEPSRPCRWNCSKSWKAGVLWGSVCSGLGEEGLLHGGAPETLLLPWMGIKALLHAAAIGELLTRARQQVSLLDLTSPSTTSLYQLSGTHSDTQMLFLLWARGLQ